MDTQSVRVLLHGLSCMQLRQQSLNGKTTYKLLGSLAKVSLLLWRHYEDTLLDDYITFVAILRKILQEVGVTAEDASSDKEDCCKTFIRITECFQNKRTVLARVSVQQNYLKMAFSDLYVSSMIVVCTLCCERYSQHSSVWLSWQHQ